jgi:hypothetical protein
LHFHVLNGHTISYYISFQRGTEVSGQDQQLTSLCFSSHVNLTSPLFASGGHRQAWQGMFFE